MGSFGIGAAVRRKEDMRFLTGKGTYTDDINRPGQLQAYLLRSPHAHAEIASIDTAKAKAAPGVAAIFTGADLQIADKPLGGLPCGWLITSKDGSPMKEPPRPLLAQGKVRHVGDPVAVVVAATRAEAEAAAELVEIGYRELPAVVAADEAIRPGGPLLFDAAPGNLCFDWHLGDKAAVDAAFARAHHVTRLDLVNNRLISNPMEPRAAIGEHDVATGDYTLYTTSQAPHVHRLLIGAFVLQLPEHKLRVVAPDVGGGFGTKGSLYNEQALVLWLAARLGRPVKWTADRSEIFLTDIRRATTSPRPRSPWTRTASSWPCGSRPWPISGPISAASRRRFPPGAMAPCSPATTRRRRSMSRSRESSPTPRRSTPIVAPGARRLAMSWSA
jgi:aerobic carbon-monoxide dehydrogenase large subunit